MKVQFGVRIDAVYLPRQVPKVKSIADLVDSTSLELYLRIL